MVIIQSRNETMRATLYKLEGASRLEVARFKAKNCHLWAQVLEVAENLITIIIDHDTQPTIAKSAPIANRYRGKEVAYGEYLRFEDYAFYDRERGLI